GGVVLGPVLGAVAQAVGIRIVPPAALVVRDAVDDLVVEVGMLEADPEQLRQVARADPDRKEADVERTLLDVADAYRQHLQAIFVGVQAGDGLTEALADAIAAVRAKGDVGADGLVAAVEADDMVAAREDDPLDALLAGGLEQIVNSDDIGPEDRLPRALDRKSAEMDNAVHAVDQVEQGVEVADIGGDELLIPGQIGNRRDVGQAQAIV